MSRLGLALSGGGFRAVLYHLGVVRFLRDAEILPNVSHITSVSGGSVLGAHLVLNWDKYCGSEVEFQQAADEVLRFLQLDVRNRIVRRFPMTSTANVGRRLFRQKTLRQYTRAGLLERHYERYLYGDTSLFQLPDRPRLHILATNLSEGCLCAFYKGGALLQRRSPGRRDRFEKVQVGLATVPMAVAASSAFPGFFPPLEIRGADVGADAGELTLQAFTDGGIYDNIGLRMFRCIEQSWIRDVAPLGLDDVLDLEAVTSALLSAEQMPENTPLKKLWEMLSRTTQVNFTSGQQADDKAVTKSLLAGLWEVMRTSQLYRDPIFQGIELTDPSAQSLLQYVTTAGQDLELSDQVWLNRQIIEAALRQVVGKPCLRSSRDGFDEILVSDAGASFKVTADGRAGGLISTALRSTDILMDRVNQLEFESFQNAPGVLFFPISDVIETSQDRNAPHPEIQRRAALIRTDMDRFSDLEISALVQHGYCVARHACRKQLLSKGAKLPAGPPWDPFANRQLQGDNKAPALSPLNDPGEALKTARVLQRSSARKIWRTLFDLRDWPTYIWAPLLAALILFIPYVLHKSNRIAQRQSMVLSAISETSPLYKKILELLKEGPITSLDSMPFEEIESLEPFDLSGFEILSDDRIYDLRDWSTSNRDDSAPHGHIRVRMRRTDEAKEEEANSHLRLQMKTTDEKFMVRCQTESLNPKLSRMRNADGSFIYEMDLDLSHVPIDAETKIVFDEMLPSEMAEQYSDGGRFNFTITADTGLAQIWMLMPEGRIFDFLEIRGFPIGHPEEAKVIVPSSTVELPFGSIATFQLINPKHNYRYECHWKWVQEIEE